MNDYRQHPTAIVDNFGADLDIGRGVDIGAYTTIFCRKKIRIGDFTRIAPHVTIADYDHDLKLPYYNIKNNAEGKPIDIGRDCWIGANAVILKGVTLGDGCVVGAGSVVTKSFPEGSIVVGNPAKLLRNRNGN